MSHVIYISIILLLCGYIYKTRREKFSLMEDMYLNNSALPLNSKRFTSSKEKLREKYNAISDGADDCENCIQPSDTKEYIESQI